MQNLRDKQGTLGEMCKWRLAYSHKAFSLEEFRIDWAENVEGLVWTARNSISSPEPLGLICK